MAMKAEHGSKCQVVGITVAAHKPKAIECTRRLLGMLAERGVEVRADASVSKACNGNCQVGGMVHVAASDLVIVMGGDGTLLGVDLGSFGVLAEEEFSDVEANLDAILAGKFEIEERLMVRATVMRGGAEVISLVGLNDAVIAKMGIRRLARLHTSVDGDYIATYPADGLIIGTPTGSTAYVLSAGGPLVDPAVESLIVTAICPHTLYTRPLVVHPKAVIEVRVETRNREPVEASLTVDGQEEIGLLAEDTIVIDRAPCNARLVRVSKHSYYERLRRKLKWGAEK